MTYAGRVAAVQQIPGGHVLVTVDRLAFAVEPERYLAAPVLTFLIPVTAAHRYTVGQAITVQMGPTVDASTPGIRIVGD